MATVTSVVVATTKFLFGMCDCTLNSGAGTGDLSLGLEILHVCGHAHVCSHVSLGMETRAIRGIVGLEIYCNKFLYINSAVCKSDFCNFTLYKEFKMK